MTTTDAHDDRLGEASPAPQPTPRGAPRLVLAFDTGSPITSVALARGGDVLAQEAAERASRSDSILALIDAVLARCGAAPRDLDALCVLRGPGSFTGLRIGLATALGLHDALGVRGGGDADAARPGRSRARGAATRRSTASSPWSTPSAASGSLRRSSGAPVAAVRSSPRVRRRSSTRRRSRR